MGRRGHLGGDLGEGFVDAVDHDAIVAFADGTDGPIAERGYGVGRRRGVVVATAIPYARSVGHEHGAMYGERILTSVAWAAMALGCGSSAVLEGPDAECDGGSPRTEVFASAAIGVQGLSVDDDGRSVIAHIPPGLGPAYRTDVYTLDDAGCLSDTQLARFMAQTFVANRGELLVAGRAADFGAVLQDDGKYRSPFLELRRYTGAGQLIDGTVVVEWVFDRDSGGYSYNGPELDVQPSGRVALGFVSTSEALVFMGLPSSAGSTLYATTVDTDGAVIAKRAFVATSGTSLGGAKIAWLPNGDLVVVTTLRGELDLDGGMLAAEDTSLAWIVMSPQLEVISAAVLGPLDGLWAMEPNASGDIIVSGLVADDAVLIRIDDAGAVVWRNTFDYVMKTAVFDASSRLHFVGTSGSSLDPAPVVLGNVSSSGELLDATVVSQSSDLGYHRTWIDIDAEGRPVISGGLAAGEVYHFGGEPIQPVSDYSVFLARLRD